MTKQPVYKDSRLRSILKACSWRFVATCTTFAIAYVVTGKTTFAFTIAGVEVFVKMLIYYFHERAWQMVPHGTDGQLLQEKGHNKPDAGDGT